MGKIKGDLILYTPAFITESTLRFKTPHYDNGNVADIAISSYATTLTPTQFSHLAPPPPNPTEEVITII